MSTLIIRRAISRATLPKPTRTLSTSHARLTDTNDDSKQLPFRQGPAPPRLPEEDQKIFEQLQKQSTGAFSTPRSRPKVNQSPQGQTQIQTDSEDGSAGVRVRTNSKGEELHRDAKEGLRPEFEGEKNPATGEVGGPKNEPLRWGAGGDWSYGGRVTDF